MSRLPELLRGLVEFGGKTPVEDALLNAASAIEQKDALLAEMADELRASKCPTSDFRTVNGCGRACTCGRSKLIAKYEAQK